MSIAISDPAMTVCRQLRDMTALETIADLRALLLGPFANWLIAANLEWSTHE